MLLSHPRLFLHGMGHHHPETVLDNRFLEELDLGVDAAWILARTGIRRRRTVLPLDYIRETRNADPREADEMGLVQDAETGARAARMALERAGLRVEDVGMVVAGSCTGQHSTPPMASAVADRLGLAVPCLDVNAACCTFVAQLQLLGGMAPGSLPDYVLAVTPDNTTRTVDYRDLHSAVLLGDGTAAAIVSPRVPGPVRLASARLDSDPSRWKAVHIPRGRHFRQDGPAVQAFAVRATADTYARLCRDTGTEATAPWFIGHQANMLMLEGGLRRGGASPERHLFNVDEYGNCGSAGGPSVLSQNWARLQPGDLAAMVLVGSGLGWGSLLFEFVGRS